MLSLAYAMLTREWTVVLFSVGFDPYLGFYHQPRYGRPALALDLMEEYRPLIADSLVLTVVNNLLKRHETQDVRAWAASRCPQQTWGRARTMRGQPP